ncbi:TonB-dependent receptor [Arcobacter sp. FW59]|nr:TonB-dependent receptor [Arcobacter sp. FW59]
MEEQQLNNLIDVMKNTTGVYSNSGPGNSGFTHFYSRGYMITNFQVDGATSAYFDSNNSGRENIDSAIYDSVSVVRGATGLLTGAGNPSGSINLVRKKPTKDFQASLEAQAGSLDKYRGVVDISGGFNEDGSIRGRFIATHDQGGYRQPVEREASTLYGIVEADLGNSTTISGSWERNTLEGNALNEEINGSIFYRNQSWGFHSLTPFDEYTWETADWTKREQTRDKFTLALDHHINDSWKISTNYSYINDDNKRRYSTCVAWVYDGSCLDNYTDNIQYEHKGHTLDAKLNGNFELLGQSHDLVIGFNGVKSNSTEISFDRTSVSGDDFKIINNRLVIAEPTWTGVKSKNDTDTIQYGGFISTRINFTEDLSAILGGRYSKYENKKNDKITSKTDNFLPYLALTYDLTDNLTTYVSYTEIFNPQSDKDRNGNYLDPETGFNYEVGLKGEWFDGRLNTSIALFQSGKDNLAVTDYINGENGECYRGPDGDCASKALNDTKNKGWEFEVAGEITPSWQAQFGFSQSILKDKDEKRLNSGTVPIRTAKLFTTYKATPSLTVGGGLRWQSETWNDHVKSGYISIGHAELAGNATQNDYFVVDLMANYEFNKNLSLLVNLNNALNEKYSNNFYRHTYGEERNWMATLKYKF